MGRRAGRRGDRLIDATLGQAIAAALGGRGDLQAAGAVAIAIVALGTITAGLGVGLVGGVLGKVVHSRLADLPDS